MSIGFVNRALVRKFFFQKDTYRLRKKPSGTQRAIEYRKAHLGKKKEGKYGNLVRIGLN